MPLSTLNDTATSEIASLASSAALNCAAFMPARIVPVGLPRKYRENDPPVAMHVSTCTSFTWPGVSGSSPDGHARVAAPQS